MSSGPKLTGVKRRTPDATFISAVVLSAASDGEDDPDFVCVAGAGAECAVDSDAIAATSTITRHAVGAPISKKPRQEAAESMARSRAAKAKRPAAPAPSPPKIEVVGGILIGSACSTRPVPAKAGGAGAAGASAAPRGAPGGTTEDCCLCFEPMQRGDPRCTLITADCCGHDSFCRACQPTLVNHKKCPICRSDILAINTEAV